jgi:hypothetical protein
MCPSCITAVTAASNAAAWLGHHPFTSSTTIKFQQSGGHTLLAKCVTYSNVCTLLQVEELDPETCSDIAAQLTQVRAGLLKCTAFMMLRVCLQAGGS